MADNCEHFDVIIVGAGLSGIGAAHHMKTKCPHHSFIILEARDAMGGTWDLFKYPGIRSDSDMYTLGYHFKPWVADEAIADGPAILDYIHETASEDGTDRLIRYNHKVIDAEWSSESSSWSINVEHKDGNRTILSCNFLFMCSGYYDYDNGYMPDFPGLEDYKGTLIHPQKWPKDLDYTDQEIIVVGSGATAVTLVPELAKKASKVTMLQRSPTYIINAPQKDVIANFLRKILPGKLAYLLSRWKNILFSLGFFKFCRKWPNAARKLIMKGVKKQLGDDYDVNKHFNPKYNPWDQRLCLVPDNDLFDSINEGKSEVITDHIETFTQKGIRLQSGKELNADIIVSATGLQLKFLGGLSLTVDGTEIIPRETHCYRGMMFSGVPNLALAFGYTNASWTLKCDLTCDYITRLLNYMKMNEIKKVIPRFNDPTVKDEPFVDFNSGYVLRSIDDLPKQGSKRPWKVYQNYILDIFNFRYSSLKDGALEFTSN